MQISTLQRSQRNPKRSYTECVTPFTITLSITATPVSEGRAQRSCRKFCAARHMAGRTRQEVNSGSWAGRRGGSSSSSSALVRLYRIDRWGRCKSVFPFASRFLAPALTLAREGFRSSSSLFSKRFLQLCSSELGPLPSAGLLQQSCSLSSLCFPACFPFLCKTLGAAPLHLTRSCQIAP